MGDDGALHVHEERTFVYDGTFRGAFYTLPLRDGQAVTGFTLRDSTGVSYEGVTGDDDGRAPTSLSSPATSSR